MTRDEIDRATILRAEVGSTLHGISINNGFDDRDEMGVCVEPFEHFCSFSDFEQFIYRSAAEREGNPNARSMAGDLDLVVYSLRKYLRLALKGNPSILLLLFAPNEKVVTTTTFGEALQNEMPARIVSRRAGRAFLGYLNAQRNRMLGTRGGRHGSRGQGFDLKYAAHMLRLGFQGLELMETGRISLPMKERGYIVEVRNGKHDIDAILQRAGELEVELRDAIAVSPLPEDPDEEFVEKWMRIVYESTWRSEAGARRITGAPPL